jgi:uncharacterized protein (DUF111 family)
MAKAKTVHFDCSSGVASDMILGALIHLGADPEEVESGLKGLGLAEFCLRVSAVERRGVSGYAAAIDIIGVPAGGDAPPHHPHTAYRDIADRIGRASIARTAKEHALAAYRALAIAEAAAHGVAIGEVHFHEVGSPRAVYSVVGAAIAADVLGATGFTCGALTDGSGVVECSHGTIPVPVPAVRELLKQTDIPLVSDAKIKTELVTPSGLALLIGLCSRYEPKNAEHRGSSGKTGYGFGSKDVGLLGAVAATII